MYIDKALNGTLIIDFYSMAAVASVYFRSLGLEGAAFEATLESYENPNPKLS